MTTSSAELRIGCFAVRGVLSGSGTMIGCEVDWDPDRKQWRANDDEHTAWSDSQKAAILAVFAKRLGCEEELRDALPTTTEIAWERTSSSREP